MTVDPKDYFRKRQTEYADEKQRLEGQITRLFEFRYSWQAKQVYYIVEQIVKNLDRKRK